VAPDLFDRGGGIARIARATALACHRFVEAQGGQLTALALHDEGGQRDHRRLPQGAEYQGFCGSRLGLARAVLERAWRPGHALTIYCHVNLAALGCLSPPQQPYVVVAHGIEVWSELPRLRRRALRRAQAVWPVSEYTARVVQRLHGVEAERCRVVHNCLDPYWTVAASDTVARPPFALAVSRISSEDAYKGVDTAIRAMARLSPSAGAAEFHVVGDGTDRGRLERLAASLGVAGRVRFHGAVDDEALRRLYSDCAFFVLPSSKEGFGIVYLEAMAAGKAVIAATETAVPEIVVDGETGRLVAAGDDRGLAAAMEGLFAAPEMAARYGRAGLRRLEERFTYPRYERAVAEALGPLWEAATGRR
jgi:glycosyltransferase involved in cell wall biosynthesis